VKNSLDAMKEDGVEEVCPRLIIALFHVKMMRQIVLETEYDNSAALSLYESLGFIREKRLYRFYLNGKDAFRLVLTVPPSYSDDGSDTTGSSPDSVISSSSARRSMYRTIRVSPFNYEDEDDEESSR
jgi:peptide alpha-N-acetyltransferase